MLIVDDDSDVRRVVGKRLRKMGHDVVEAVDYVSAVAAIDEDPFELILCDFNIMHGGRRGWKHGGHVLEYLRKKDKEVPFYFVSGLFAMVKTERQDRYLEMANGFLQKPVSREQIQELVERHCPCP